MTTPSTDRQVLVEKDIKEVATEHFWRFYVKSKFGIVPSDDEKNT